MNDKTVEKAFIKFASSGVLTRGVSIFAARFLLIIMVVLLLCFVVLRSENWFWQAALVFGVLLVTWGMTTLMQFFFARHRPFDAGFKPLIKPWITSPSFPSNHSSISFAAATYGTLMVPEWGFWLFPLATVIALSRIAVGVHYLSDIVVGAGFGVTVAIVVKIMLNLGT